MSDMENGTMQPDAETLLMLSLVLHKPVAYFFPDRYGELMRLEALTSQKEGLLLQAQRLNNTDLRRLIAQAKALADLNIADQ